MVEKIVLTNEVTRAKLELSMEDTPHYILESIDWGEIESTHHSYKYVNQVGQYITDTTLETRPIEINGWVIADTEQQMSVRKQMLNRFVNPQQLIEIKYKENILDFLPDTSVKYGKQMEENNEVMCKFQIAGVAPDPLFHEAVANQQAAATTSAFFHFPLIINATEQRPPVIIFGLRQPSLLVNVYNKGAVSTGMTFVFRAKSTVINPSLINVNTQEFFKINKTMSAGEQVTVNTNIGEKKIIGEVSGLEYNYFKYRDLDSSWLQLEVGDNLFRYEAEENLDGLECFIYYYNRYLEVQECS